MPVSKAKEGRQASTIKMDVEHDPSSLTLPLLGTEDLENNPRLIPNGATPSFQFGNGLTNCSSEREQDEELDIASSGWVMAEVKKQLWLAGPMITVSFLQYSLTVVSVMFVGHLGELSLAGAALAASFAGVSGFSLLVGMGSALETLCGQAYGARQYHMLGIFLQRAMVVLYLTSIPVAIVWYNMAGILVSLGQDPQIAAKSGEYARFLIPGLFAYATLQPLVKFLQAQSIVFPMACFSITTLCCHIPLCYLLIYKFGVGFRGAALATSMSNWLNVCFLASYVKFSGRCKKTWTTFSTEAFNDLQGFFKLAIPSAIMFCLESWSFEIIVILSGLLPNPQLETSALSICLTTSSLLYMVPFGLGAATSTRISNELGAARPQAAKRAVAVSVGFGMFEGAFVATLLLSVRNSWGWVFTNELEVVQYVARVIPLLAFLAVMDAVQGVLTGTVRGGGWQAYGAITNLGSYYIVGTPLGYVLAFVYHWNGFGLWAGLICGVAVQLTSLAVMTLRTDWDQLASSVVTRMYDSANATLPTDANEEQKEEIGFLVEGRNRRLLDN